MDMADSSADDDCPGSTPSSNASFNWDIGGNMVDDILSTSWYLLLVCVANNAGNDDEESSSETATAATLNCRHTKCDYIHAKRLIRKVHVQKLTIIVLNNVTNICQTIC